MTVPGPIFTLILCIMLVSPASAAEPGVQPAASPGAVEVPPGFLELPLEELPPHLRVIREVLDSRGARLTELQLRYEGASSDEQALEIQREIHILKQGTELALLNAQLEFARQEGDSQKVTELEAILETIRSRDGVLGPAARPDGETP
jgi:hypothetical protein